MYRKNLNLTPSDCSAIWSNNENHALRQWKGNYVFWNERYKEKRGVLNRPRVPGSQNQIKIPKCFIRTFLHAVRSMLIAKRLSSRFWTKDVNMAVQTLKWGTNFGMSRETTPSEIKINQKPNIGHCRVFGGNRWYKVWKGGFQFSSKSVWSSFQLIFREIHLVVIYAMFRRRRRSSPVMGTFDELCENSSTFNSRWIAKSEWNYITIEIIYIRTAYFSNNNCISRPRNMIVTWKELIYQWWMIVNTWQKDLHDPGAGLKGIDIVFSQFMLYSCIIISSMWWMVLLS